MGKSVDLTGQRFGRLTVLQFDTKSSRTLYWLVRCDCGIEKSVAGPKLRSGNTSSCGCLSRELSGERVRVRNRRHGLAGSATWIAWASMKARCTNPSAESYRYYGGRGITVCQRWLDSFENFLSDMGEKPAGLTLDRIETNGHYEPGNCRWATPLEQVRNRRSTYLATLEGRTLSVMEWCREFGIGWNPVYERIKRGIEPADALADVLTMRGLSCHSTS